MAWIKFEKDLQTDPRVLKIARSISSTYCLQDRGDGGNGAALPAVTLVCGALVRLWCLADSHVAADDILDMPAAEINDAIGIPNFCSLMPEDWFEDLGECVKLPGFHIHNGTEAKRKSVTAKRVERFRKRNAPALHGGNGESVTRPRPRPDLDQTIKSKTIVGLAPDVAPPVKQNLELRKQAEDVLAFLNSKTGKNFDLNGANADHVVARLRAGESPEDCRAVVAFKAREWSGNPEMAKYLRPETLFNRTKFATYKGQLPKAPA